MTYNEAKKWLEKLGGTWIEAKEQVAHKGSVIVTVETAMRGSMSRHALFDDRLQGYEREIAIRKAFVQACENLKYELGR